jgi:hypothetical protein
MDEAELGAGLGHGLSELLGAKFAAVVGGDCLQLQPAWKSEKLSHTLDQFKGVRSKLST